MFTPTTLLYKIFEEHPLVCTDSRELKKGAVFFALKGPNFNGNQFAEQALASGCAYAVVDEDIYVKDKRFLFVPDVLEALQALANYHVRMLNTQVIAITGSNGKTTTKELVYAVLSKKYKVLATKGNLNNHIGVPLTLLSLTPLHEMAVVEMGANHVGEIAVLCELAEPDFGIITNIGSAHLEGFGSLEGVLKAKSELYHFLKKKKGLVFVNAENSQLLKAAEGNRIESYGPTNQVNVQGTLVKGDPFIKLRWKRKESVVPLIEHPVVNMALVGKYNLENILAAVCVGCHFGVEEQKINEALEGYVPSNSRSQLMEKGSCKIVLDAYNANPTSMRAAIENFESLHLADKVLILGDMLELGIDSAREHQEIMGLIKSKGFPRVFLIGKNFKAAENTIGAVLFDTTDVLCEYLKGNPLKNSSLLIKGSRGLKLERVLEVLT